MKQTLWSGLAFAAVLPPLALQAGEAKRWSVDATLYGLAAGMSGEIAVKGIDIPLDVGFTLHF